MHSTFGTSRLVRLLGGWAPVDADRSGLDFAERTSLWVGPLDAIRLQAAYQSIRGTPATPARSAARGSTSRSLQADVQRVRGVLSKAIGQDPLALANLKPDDPDFSYEPFRQRHLDLQRQMEQMITTLRDHVRQAVSGRSPRLRQLAALDAALEEALAVREQKLLPTAAALLERRFNQLRRTAQQASSSSAAAGDDDGLSSSAKPEDPRTPDCVDPRIRGNDVHGWLHAFGQEWRQTLLAELDLRLEPVAGLLDALRNEHEHAT